MLSLAAFRFRNALASAGGPIEKLEVADTVVLGERCFLANAYLIGALAGDREAHVLYNRANGSGTDRSQMVARFKAISEAIERWAHWQSYPERRYGFDVDPS